MTKKSYPDGPGVYADILLDTWFKRAFKEYGNAKRLMLLFLQALIPERKIVSIEYASEESTNQQPDGKNIRVDVECCDDNGRRFVVEVQQCRQHDFYDRAVFNSTFAVQRQLQGGTGRYGFPAVYFIGIIRFSLHGESERFLYRYSLKDDQTGELMTDSLHYIFLEVPKCRLTPESTPVEKLGYALDKLQFMDKKPDNLDGEFFDLLFTSADLRNFAPEEKSKYLSDMTTERDIRNQIDYARDEGRAEGRAEGREEGREEGIAQRNREIARAMREKRYAPAVIQELTGLSPEEVSAL